MLIFLFSSMFKTVLLLYIFVETLIIFQDSLLNITDLCAIFL